MKWHQEVSQERLDRATRNRLAQLSVVPVDTSRLERRLEVQVDEAVPRERPSLTLPGWVRAPKWVATGGLAAVLLLVVSLLTLNISIESPVVAAPAQMAGLHRAMASGEIPVTALDGGDAARALIGVNWPARDPLAALPPSMVKACCLHSVDGKPVLGTLVKHEKGQFALVIADAESVRPPAGPQVVRGERRYVVHESGGAGVVMTHAGGKFLCFVGNMPTAELIQVAEQMLGSNR